MAPFTLAFLALFVMIWLVSYLRVRSAQPPQLRSVPAYDMIRGSMAEAAEDGRPVHLALGHGGIGDAFAMETLAGLTTLEYLSDQAIALTNLPLVSTGSPTTMLLAQDIISRSFKARDQFAEYDPQIVRFMGGSEGNAGAAYAAGVIDLLDHRYVAANFMLGHFGDEYLLMGEVGARNNIPQVAGSADPHVLPFMAASANRVLMGEELFAAGAYLMRLPWHVAGLVAQDGVRWIIVGAVGAVVLLRTLGLLQ